MARLPVHQLTGAGIKKVLPSHGLRIEPPEIVLGLSEPSGQRPRIYAYLMTGEFAGQVVKLTSLETYEKYKDDIQFAWVTQFNSMADFIKQVVRNGQS